MPIHIPIANAQTLPELFRARIALTPDAIAYREHDGGQNRWTDWTWRKTGEETDLWRAALANERLEPGARVATLMANSRAYVCVDQAALSLGLAIVPMHATDNPGNIAYILGDSGAEALVIDSSGYWARLAPEVAGLSTLKRIILMTGSQPSSNGPAGLDRREVQAEQWLTIANRGESRATLVTPEMMAAIVYTSGTTGSPKGVVLSHRNIVSNVQAVMQCVAPGPDDIFLSFLPLSHTFERTAGYYLPIASGSIVAFARSIALLGEDLRQVRPTILVSVPRIYERASLRIQETLAKSGAFGQWLFAMAERIGWHRFLVSQNATAQRVPMLEQLLWPVLDWLVANKIRAEFGGKLRVAITGGAPMPEAVSRRFLAMGINILQGYGMTETAPVVSVNRLERNDPASVGEAIPGVEIRIGDNDELLVRGPNVMAGYWQRPDETRQVLQPDGWLHSGDQARIDGGRITIKGRIKDIIVTSTGEKISPADLETAITGDPLFDQVIVIGEQRPFIAAIAVLNGARLEEKAKALGITGGLAEALVSKAIRALAIARIKRAVAHLPAYATPRKVCLTLEPWTVGAGLMTPTLKLKRQAIQNFFRQQISELYGK